MREGKNIRTVGGWPSSHVRGREKANIGLTTLVLYLREEEEKAVGQPNVRPEGQVNAVGFRGKEAWAGSGLCGLKIL